MAQSKSGEMVRSDEIFSQLFTPQRLSKYEEEDFLVGWGQN